MFTCATKTKTMPTFLLEKYLDVPNSKANNSMSNSTNIGLKQSQKKKKHNNR
jgi:hypothetical protein